MALVGVVLLVLAVPAARAEESGPELQYTTMWFGNNFGDGVKWVQMTANGMFVAADGTIYLNTFWDEGGREVGIYRNGDVVGNAGHTHGWGYNGGFAVTVNEKYLFIAQVVDCEGGGLKDPGTWPAKGRKWYGISRRLRDGKPAPFPGGKGGKGDTLKGCFLVVDEVPDKAGGGLYGLAANDKQLFVSDQGEGKIKVYDAEQMTPLTAWDVPRVSQMVLGKDGTLWMIQAGEAGEKAAPAKVVRYAADGKKLPQEIAGVAAPSALCLDGQGRLLVADNGPDQQIKFFTELDKTPKQAATFGKPGGIFSGTKGLVEPLKFNGLCGVGTDDAGNIYVCQNGSGLVLQSYTPDGKLNWELLGLEFVDCADVDPADETQVYTREEHFVLDYTKSGGEGWKYKGYTVDRFKRPNDSRLHVDLHSVFARRIKGKFFLYGTDMYSNGLHVLRVPGGDEMAYTCGFFAKGRVNAGGWPPNQPAKGEWIWRDKNGNGDFEADEFEGRAENGPALWGWWVDSQGDVWQACENTTIRRFPCGGLDEAGAPMYSYATLKTQKGPEPFNRLERLEYFPETDTMYLAGYSKEFAHNGKNWKTIGKVVCRYDRWSKEPAKRCEIHVPFDEAQEGSKTYGTPVAMSVAGDYVFVVYLKTAEVRVWDTGTGEYQGRMRPGKDVSGWVDIPYGVRAFKRANGEYLVFVEEDWKAKGMVYRWRPAK
jgi:hypothetical protein